MVWAQLMVFLEAVNFYKMVQKAERNIKRRLPIGSKTNVSKLVQEMGRRQFNESVVNKALSIMASG